MIALGLALVALLLFSANAFSRASVRTIKQLLVWVAALAGLSLAMLVLTGRTGPAIAAALLFGPAIWDWWKNRRHPTAPGPKPSSAPPRPGPMTRAEALEILGLHDPATEADIRAAWVRVMRGVHPDTGGTDWLAARVNQARDILLRGR